MALNEFPARVTRYSVSYLIVQDGQVGTTMVLHNNDFVGLLEAFDLGGPLHSLLVQDVAVGNSQALQRMLLLGDASGLGGEIDLSNIPHCHVSIQPETVAGWSVDANVDGNDAERGQLEIIGPAGAGRCLVTLEFRHSFAR